MSDELILLIIHRSSFIVSRLAPAKALPPPHRPGRAGRGAALGGRRPAQPERADRVRVATAPTERGRAKFSSAGEEPRRDEEPLGLHLSPPRQRRRSNVAAINAVMPASIPGSGTTVKRKLAPPTRLSPSSGVEGKTRLALNSVKRERTNVSSGS